MGGFKEWLFTQQGLSAQEARREEAIKLAREQGLRYDEAALSVLLQGVTDMASKFNYGEMQEQLAAKPDQFIALFNGLSRLVAANNALERRSAKILHLEPKTPSQSALYPRRKGGLTLEERTAAEKRMRLFEGDPIS